VPLAPLHNGYRLWLAGIVRELARRHDVRLVGYLMPDQEGAPAVDADIRSIPYARPGPAGNAADLARAVTLRRPLRAHRMAAGLRGALREELDRFRPDVVQVGTGKLSGLRPEVGRRPCVLHVQDAWHVNIEARAAVARGPRRALLSSDARRVRRFEAERYRGWDRVVPCNPDDMRTLLALDPTLPMACVPIGVDAGAFAPDPAVPRVPGRIVFHGNMAYAPNVAAAELLARGVLPRVRAARHDAHLVVAGRDPAPGVRALAALPGVSVTGAVDDIRAEILRASVWCGPFDGGTGMKTKVLEAMATDTPTVVTPIGARGLDRGAGAFLVGAGEDELVEHLVHVLDYPLAARRLGRAGGQYVRDRHDWGAVGLAFERLYEEVIAERRAATG
jgi:glycosyltransferase involved in cell wall biosynthesis